MLYLLTPEELGTPFQGQVVKRDADAHEIAASLLCSGTRDPRWALATTCSPGRVSRSESPLAALESWLRAPDAAYWVEIDQPEPIANPKPTDRFEAAFMHLAQLRGITTPKTAMVWAAAEQILCDRLSAQLDELDVDQRRALIDQLSTLPEARIPWHRVKREPNALAILYNFSPYTDTGAVVASKRMRQWGDVFDVISCSFENRKKVDPTIARISAPYIAETTYLPLTPTWATWDGFKAFAYRAARIAESKVKSGRNYDYLYSRAMWAPSHYAAALTKKSFPHLKWVAEFSDPLSLDVEGASRAGEQPVGPLMDSLIASVEERFGQVPESHRTIFSVAELVAYADADVLLFTNDHQRTTMLEHIYSATLRDRVAARAEVSNHPTLPAPFYHTEIVEYEVDPEVVNLAYFGEFYATRGLTELTAAIRLLPEVLQRKIHLHVFSNYIPPKGKGGRPRGMSAKAYGDLVERAMQGVGGYGIEDQIHLNPSLPFLHFLAITSRFDFLIVNDAHSGVHHLVNPYLPSKWSDYSGSDARTWAFVEAGSSLSAKPASILTPLGDLGATVRELEAMAQTKAGRMT